MIRYIFKNDAIPGVKAADKLDAQAIGEELDRIAEANNGELSPQAIVDRARNPRSPLHKHFEWNNLFAAEAHRRDQARTLVRLIAIEPDTDRPPVRAFLSVNQDGVKYRRLGDVLDSRDLSVLVIAQARKDLEAFLRRYSEMRDVCALIEAARAKLIFVMDKKKPPSAA